MDISEYRNRGRRRIELPSGLAGFVRAPSVMDLAAYPKLLGATMNGDDPGEGDSTREWIHCLLRRCFIPERGVMTDKEPGECLPGELSVHELDAEDAGAIISAVTAFGADAAAPGGEAGQDAAFPEGAD